MQKVASRVLESLDKMNACKVMHCHIRPENILLRNPLCVDLIIIGFGDASYFSENIKGNVEISAYSAPEVLFDMPITSKIDIWGMGCVLAEMYLGRPLFSNSPLEGMVDILGLPPAYMVDGRLLKGVGDRKLEGILAGAEKGFTEFVGMCLEWDPEKRISAKKALKHPWIRQ